MQQSRTQTYNEIAAKAHDLSPERMGNLVVLDAASPDKPVYVAPEIAGKLAQDTAEIRKAVAYWKNYMDETGAAGAADRHYDLAGTTVDVIALNSAEKLQDVFSDKFTPEMLAVYNLNHEIGHILLKNGRSPDNRQLGESAADAYAMLRHIQRYGKNTGYPELRSSNMTMGLIMFGDMEHYTADTIEKINRLPEKYITGLPDQETVALAEKIAGECALNEMKLNIIRLAFAPVTTFFEEDRDSTEKMDAFDYYTTLARKTLDVMKGRASNPEIVKAGQRLLNVPEVKSEMLRASLTEEGDYWKQALRLISASNDNAQASPQQRRLEARP